MRRRRRRRMMMMMMMMMMSITNMQSHLVRRLLFASCS